LNRDSTAPVYGVVYRRCAEHTLHGLSYQRRPWRWYELLEHAALEDLALGEFACGALGAGAILGARHGYGSCGVG
jgi:hypothetical protein